MTARVSAHQALIAPPGSAASVIASARRAVQADRYAPGSFAVEWRELTQLEPIAAEWRELAARAIEPNVFYEPAFALDAAPVFAPDAGAVLIWSGTEPRRLLGLFPARVERRRFGFTLPILVGLTHPYGPLGVPLVERDAAEPVIAAWLAHIAGDAALPGLVMLPFLPIDGPFAATLAPILRRARMPAADFDRHQRALLQPDGDRTLYIERSVGRHQHKELRRHWRRLGDTGAVLLTSATEPAAVAMAVEDFFVLEAAGWKGRAGTASADDDDVRRFIRGAVVSLAAEGQASIDRIMVDGRAIAAAIVLRSGRDAWFWKIAYDETFASLSPGVMLSVIVTDELLDDPNIVRADSCAVANHPMIDHLWRERLGLCNRLIAVRPSAPFSVARRLEGLRSAAMAGVKTIRGRFRR
jgi:CelD/BcsL family acetyltransferase involved in cellulose biosynthesis